MMRTIVGSAVKWKKWMCNVKYPVVNLVAVSVLLVPGTMFAQIPGRLPTSPVNPSTTSSYLSSSVDVIVRDANGAPVTGQVMVQLIRANGQVYDQGTVRNGRIKFTGLPKTDFTVLVMAPGYQKAEKRFEIISDVQLITINVDLSPIADAEDAPSSKGMAALNPKAQKDVGKALELLRANKPNDARNHLEAAEREAPYSAEVEYLFGVYASQLHDPVQAQAHWRKALALNPKHLNALIALGQELLHEHKAEEAIPYLDRAFGAEPSSYRAQMLLAEADYMQGQRADTILHAERAMELGHERASSVEPLLARALAESGQKERAIQVLQQYLKTNPADVAAANQLKRWETPQGAASDDSATASEMAAVTSGTAALSLPSSWLPPDVDEKVPAVEPGAACSLDDVVQKAANRVVELIHDVDRFTATESLVDESINKWGVASIPEKRKFDYVVSIQEIRQGWLGVEEYRNSDGAPAQFPEGIATNGLPALVLIFHPFYAPNYDMACEGLARWNGGLAWQVHFRQRPGKPVANKAYRYGIDGPSYPVALKGRAWISADTYQIVRMETDLVAPVPEIRLVAEHTAIEYGSVNFREGNVNLWLPQSAEVYFDWKGRRIHRRHSFSNYLLFAVDDRQHISAPKTAQTPTDLGAGETAKP
ncbi:MAG TPA: tetratricopeptide repeat protein [Candidatus Acidoferrum sp.]|nr:tetratricopeptide repeat protein [Candidatus Acidoferrum sp.]